MFALTIVLYVLRRFTVFAIFKHFLVNGNELKKLILYSSIIYFVIVNLDGITFFSNVTPIFHVRTKFDIYVFIQNCKC